MSGITDDDIRAWVRERFEEVLEEGALSIIGLVHFSASGAETALDAQSSKSPAAQWNADAVATRMSMIAARHSRGLPGVQQLQLIGAYGSSGRPIRFLPFQRVGALMHGAMPGGGLATEAATPTGMTQQAQRWGEIALQGATAKDQHLFTVMSGVIADLRTDNRATVAENREFLMALKTLVAEQIKQSHEVRMAELREARMTEFARSMTKLAPSLINTLAGKELVPQHMEDTALVEGLAERLEQLTEEQRCNVIEVMQSTAGTGEFAAALMSRLSRHREKRAAEAEGERRLMASLPTRSFEEAERDAAGEAIRLLSGQKPPTSGPVSGTSGRTHPSNGPAAHVEAKAAGPATNAVAQPVDGHDGNGASASEDSLWTDIMAEMGSKKALVIQMLRSSNPALADRFVTRYGG